MYDIDTKLAALFVTCTLLGSACDHEIVPELTDAAEPGLSGQASVLLNGARLDPIEEAVELRMGPLPDGSYGVLGGADGRLVAPGVWEVEAKDGFVQQVVVGQEGQLWLLEQMTAELDALRDRLGAETGQEDALREQIAAVEEAIATTTSSLDELTTGPGGVQAPSCNISLYAGPSGPVSGIPGAAALAQSSCSGGCATITVRSQACCNGACTPLSIATNTVCASPWTAGVIRQGSGPGWAQVYVAPVLVTNQGFSCY